METPDLEQMAHALEATGDYRILRRLKPHFMKEVPAGVSTKTGLFVDVETTGLDTVNDEVIELAMVPFKYSADGQVFAVGEPLAQFNEPSFPISDEIVALTGITQELVAGHHLDREAIDKLATPAALILAHNAAFDRPFLERVSHIFATKPWACSMRDIHWKEEGMDGRRLADLLGTFGFFFEGHRAVEDCLAAVALLTMSLPKSGKTAMTALLENARATTYRIAAVGAPFEAKDALKARGYRWNTDPKEGPRSWWIEIGETEIKGELAFLEQEIFHGPTTIPIKTITAFERFSNRR